MINDEELKEIKKLIHKSDLEQFEKEFIINMYKKNLELITILRGK